VQPYERLGTDAAFHDLRAVMALLSPQDAELAATAKALLEWHRSHRFCAACGAQSVMVHAGWQKVVPGLQHPAFPAHRPGGDHADHLRQPAADGPWPTWPEGMYSLLAGFVEPGETIEAAVRREVFEESGSGSARSATSPASPGRFRLPACWAAGARAISEEITRWTPRNCRTPAGSAARTWSPPMPASMR